MVTSHLDSSPGIDISLPSLSAKPSTNALEKITVVLDKEGDCYLEKRRISLRSLYETMKVYASEKYWPYT